MFAALTVLEPALYLFGVTTCILEAVLRYWMLAGRGALRFTTCAPAIGNAVQRYQRKASFLKRESLLADVDLSCFVRPGG